MRSNLDVLFLTATVVSLKFHIQSLMCLALALQNEFDNGSDDNKFAIAEVTTTVRIVQYLGIVIGVLMGKLEISVMGEFILFNILTLRMILPSQMMRSQLGLN